MTPRVPEPQHPEHVCQLPCAPGGWSRSQAAGKGGQMQPKGASRGPCLRGCPSPLPEAHTRGWQQATDGRPGPWKEAAGVGALGTMKPQSELTVAPSTPTLCLLCVTDNCQSMRPLLCLQPLPGESPGGMRPLPGLKSPRGGGRYLLTPHESGVGAPRPCAPPQVCRCFYCHTPGEAQWGSLCFACPLFSRDPKCESGLVGTMGVTTLRATCVPHTSSGAQARPS